MRASDNSSFRDAGQDLRVKPETVTSQTAANNSAGDFLWPVSPRRTPRRIQPVSIDGGQPYHHPRDVTAPGS